MRVKIFAKNSISGSANITVTKISYINRFRYAHSFLRRFLAPWKWLQMYGLTRLEARDRKRIMPFFRAKVQGRGRVILFASFINLPHTLKIEGLFSRMLQSMGWRGVCLHLPGSIMVKKYHGRVFGNETININQFIPWEMMEQSEKKVDHVIEEGYEAIKAFEYCGSMVGIMSLASLSGSDLTGLISTGTENRSKLRKLMIRSCLYTEGCKNLLKIVRPGVVLAMEKGGVSCSEIFFQAIESGVDYVQWLGCHEPNSIMLKRYNRDNVRNHPFSISPNSWMMMCEKPWDEMFRQRVMQEFEHGYSGNKWFAYKKLTDHTKMFSRREIMGEYQLDVNKKMAVIFSPVLNDANLFFGEDLFKGGFREWLVETVKAARMNDNVNWVLKLHPANIYRRANAGYSGEYGEILAIKEALGALLSNFHVIYPDDDINPLSLFKCLDYGLTVRGTVGAEIPCFGKPVLTAGTGRYSGLGFTEDSKTAEEYLGKVRNIHEIPLLSEDKTRLALKHAHLFFNVRPAKYTDFAEDVYAYPQGHPFNRDISFKGQHFSDLAQSAQLGAIIDWITESKDADFLTPGML